MRILGMLMATEARTPSSSQPSGSLHTGAPEQGLGFPTLPPPSNTHPALRPILFSINERD